MVRLTVLVVVLALVVAGAATPIAATAGSTGTATPDEVATNGNGPPTAAAVGAATDLVTLTIKVRSNTGDPLGSVRVNVSHSQGTNTTRTFSNGNALVDVPRGDDVTIRVSDDQYIKNHPVTVNSVGENEEVVVTMYPKATAQVTVEDASGPVNDARVTLHKEGSGQVAAEGRTGSDGLYQSPQVEAGTYVATVVKTGYRQTTKRFSASGLVSTTVTLEEATVPVNVKVEDDHFRDAQPVQGATVSVNFDGETIKQAKTGNNGNTQLSIGVNGQYTIRVTKDGYEVSEQTFYLAEDGKSFTFTISRERSLSLTAVNNRVLVNETVLVRVRNAYGEAVEGATVTRNGTEVGATDGSGELRVEIPEPGNYEIAASKEGVSSGSVIVQGRRAAVPTPTETPTATPTATPTPTPTPTTTTASSDSVLGLPGFGTGVAVVAVLLAVAALAARRRGS